MIRKGSLLSFDGRAVRRPSAFLFALSSMMVLIGCSLGTPGSSAGSSIWTTFGYLPAWRSMGSPGFSGNAIGPISIAAGPSGTAAVVYQDWGPGRATGMQFNGTNWATMGVPGFSTGTINTPSVAYDSVGNVYAAYQDASAKATVMRFNGASWTNVGLPRFTPGNATDTSLALDSSSIPYVAFSDGAAIVPGAASVMKFNGTSWVFVGSKGFSGGLLGVSSTSLAIDGSGNLYVGYADGNAGNFVTVREYSAGNWSLVGLQGFAGSANYVSLAINPITSEPYVLFNDQSDGGRASVWRFHTGAWVIVGSQGFSSGLISGVSLKFDSSGVPYAGFRDAGNGNYGTVMKFNGTAWVTVGYAGFTPGSITYDSMTVDSNNVPILVFSDNMMTNFASALAFH